MNKNQVKSILLYNCITWALRKIQEQQIGTIHCKQLRQILGRRYKTKISNATLYKKTGEKHISKTIWEARWKHFGYILRKQHKISANMAIEFYFLKRKERGFQGRRITTLPLRLLHKATSSLWDHSYYKRLKLNNEEVKSWSFKKPCQRQWDGKSSQKEFWKLEMQCTLLRMTRNTNKSSKSTCTFITVQ